MLFATCCMWRGHSLLKMPLLLLLLLLVVVVVLELQFSLNVQASNLVQL